MLHTHEVEGSSPPVSTKKKTTPSGVVFLFIGKWRDSNPSDATVQWTVAGRQLDGGHTLILSSPPVGSEKKQAPDEKSGAEFIGWDMAPCGWFGPADNRR